MKLILNSTILVALVAFGIVITIDYIRNCNVKTISGIELLRLRRQHFTTTMILLTLLLWNVLERIL